MKDIKIEMKSEFLIKEEILEDDLPASSPLEPETEQKSVKNGKKFCTFKLYESPNVIPNFSKV